jgi:hypothetical protein
MVLLQAGLSCVYKKRAIKPNKMELAKKYFRILIAL